jgi:hypothetical protein
MLGIFLLVAKFTVSFSRKTLLHGVSKKALYTFGMRWAGHVARMGEDRGMHKVLVGKPERKSHRGDQGIDGKIILRWIFRKLEIGRATCRERVWIFV